MRQSRHWLRRCAGVGLVVAAVVVAGTSGASAVDGQLDAGAATGDHCIAPWGEDFNETFDTSARIVTSFFDCTRVNAGERWTLPLPLWGMNKTFQHEPKGFVPAGDTPLEDFLAKFTGAKYVIDPGTDRELTYVYSAAEGLWMTSDPDGDVVTTVHELPPLPVGGHVVEAYWVFNGTHCDGWAKKIDECLTGEWQRVVESFEVTSRDD